MAEKYNTPVIAPNPPRPPASPPPRSPQAPFCKCGRIQWGHQLNRMPGATRLNADAKVAFRLHSNLKI
jgi:hypothetical protein